jgi:CheY-like chemotaxis protein
MPAQSLFEPSILQNGAIVILGSLLLLTLYLSYRKNQNYRQNLQQLEKKIDQKEEEANYQNLELEAKSISLDLLNKKLVSEMAEREKMEKSSFARDRFLATMSNEMRTPLNVITGLTHVLLKEKPREDQVEHLRNLQFSANDIVVFINDVLDFSNIEAGKLHLEDREFSPRNLVEDVHRKFSERATERQLDFFFGYDKKIPDFLLGDDVRMIQILTNLLTNTFKYTQQGVIKLSVVLHELRARDVMLKISIEGTDGGVNRGSIEEMFKPHHTGEGDFEGYDSQQFSLAITKRLVELQNGKIDVDIQEGESTLFTVLLPFKLVLDLQTSVKKQSSSAIEALDDVRILVVEDNKINQLVVSKMLKQTGAEVVLANNGMDALAKVETNDFDLILMDIQMPEMDGYRATAEIRRHSNPQKSDIPIIALTASAFLTEKEKAVLFGMNDHVGKPFSPVELMEKIKNCLRVHSE